MENKIRFGIIGTSGIAPTHIDAIKKLSKANTHYIYSRDPKRVKSWAERFGLIPTQSYEEILNNNTIDAIAILTEPERHGKLALQAIRHQKHVLIEKPLDIDLSVAEKVLKESLKSSTVSSVISQNRFDPIIIKMKKDLENGIIGKPFLSEIKLFWPRSEEYYKSGTGWRSQYGDVLINQAVHFIDIAMWFFGNPINIHSISSKVKESISCNDTASIILEFPDNVLFNLTCTTACHTNPPIIFNIYGAKGKLNYKHNHISHFMWKIINKTLFKNKVTPLHHQINDFINAIINNRTPAVTVKEAFEVLRVIKECE